MSCHTDVSWPTGAPWPTGVSSLTGGSSDYMTLTYAQRPKQIQNPLIIHGPYQGGLSNPFDASRIYKHSATLNGSNFYDGFKEDSHFKAED